MSQYTYAAIAPLVASSQVSGRTLSVTFRCPVSGAEVPSRAPVQAAAQRPDTTSRVKGTVQRTVTNELRWAVSRAIRSAFGHNMVGRVASQVAYDAVNSATRDVGRSYAAPSAADQQEAVVAAFRQVADQFAWDGGRWLSSAAATDHLSPFQLQLQRHPATHPYDRLTASRMLVELASADGSLAQEEEALLIEFIDPEAGTIQDLMRRPPLTLAELGQTSQGGVRTTLLTLAWVLALSDERFDQREQSKLDAFARGLGLAGPGEQEARGLAEGFILDQAMDRLFGWGQHTPEARQHLYDLARALHIPDARTMELEARFMRRQGMG